MPGRTLQWYLCRVTPNLAEHTAHAFTAFKSSQLPVRLARLLRCADNMAQDCGTRCRRWGTSHARKSRHRIHRGGRTAETVASHSVRTPCTGRLPTAGTAAVLLSRALGVGRFWLPRCCHAAALGDALQGRSGCHVRAAHRGTPHAVSFSQRHAGVSAWREVREAAWRASARGAGCAGRGIHPEQRGSSAGNTRSTHHGEFRHLSATYHHPAPVAGRS